MRRDIHDLHVIGDNIFFQPLGDFLRQAGFKIHQQFIGEAQDIQVALHPALGSGDGSITTFARAKLFYIIGNLSM